MPTYVVQQLFRAFLPPGLDRRLSRRRGAGRRFLVAGAVGMVLERSVIRFLYGRPLETLLATWGVSLILQQAVRSIFGAPNKEVSNPSWMTGGLRPDRRLHRHLEPPRHLALLLRRAWRCWR